MNNLEYILTKSEVNKIIRKGEGYRIDPNLVSLYGDKYRYETFLLLRGKQVKRYVRTDKIKDIAKEHSILLF